MKVGDIVVVGYQGDSYLAVVTDIDKSEGMVEVKRQNQSEELHPLRCVHKAEPDEMTLEL